MARIDKAKNLPSLDRVDLKCEIKGVRENEEAFIVRVGCMSLQILARLHLGNLFPVLAKLETRLDEDTILISREICTADDLADEIYLGLEISFNLLGAFCCFCTRVEHVQCILRLLLLLVLTCLHLGF